MLEIVTPLGPLYIQIEEGYVCRCSWHGPTSQLSKSETIRSTQADFDCAEKAVREINAYFSGNLKEFSLPLRIEGTYFQKKVWNALLHIKYGMTETYGELAKRIGNPKAARAVGMACKNNPLGLMIPCHRVVGSRSKKGGYNGGIEKKIYLLEFEERNSP
ncbi:MAG: methylated-DNA--[protein]-cysteine S-methyltransferase [Muribaculaceae bacterium]|nr:methylated-DNA--[protein]-cysteine S-methyltransferase [Muribaculaceae bacterium]